MKVKEKRSKAEPWHLGYSLLGETSHCIGFLFILYKNKNKF